MIVGIAGGSCSGKTTLVTRLAADTDACLVSLDRYFKDPATFPRAYRHPDYDRLEALDCEAFLDAVDRARHHCDVVVVEGFLILASEATRQRLDVAVFVDLDTDVLVQRRIARDPDTPRDYIENVVRERHEALVLPGRRYADVVLDGENTIETLLAEVTAIVQERGLPLR